MIFLLPRLFPFSQKALKGATPVPGPIIMIGVSGFSGGLKFGLC